MRVEEELKTYLLVLWRYKWMIAACAAAALVVALGISLILTPIYSATTTVRVASSPGGYSDYTYSASFTRLSNTYVEIATSDISLDEVTERLGLPEQPEVEVEVVPETELIEITAFDPDPARARDIANTLAGLLVEQSMQLYGGNVPTAREILEGQLAQAKIDLDTAVEEYGQALRAAQSAEDSSPDLSPVTNSNVEALEHLVSVRQQIYSDLLQKYETARTSEQLHTNAITITEPAFLPKKPSSPKTPLNAALGLAAGLTMGVVLAFLLEGMDDTLRGVEDVEAMTSLPIICRIPDLKRGSGITDSLNFNQGTDFSPQPAFDHLRAYLMLFDGKLEFTSYLITSPEPGDGKSTVAANLAVSLAQGGSSVVLVDMDFRRPQIHSAFGLQNEKGLSNFIQGESRLEEVFQTTAFANLTVVTTGSSPHGILEWLTPVYVQDLLEKLGRAFDYILIDAPAMLSVADPLMLASQVGGVILVVTRRKTVRQNLRSTLQQLTDLKVRITGIVVNKVPDSQIYHYYTQNHNGTHPEKMRKLSLFKTVASTLERTDEIRKR